MYLIEFIRDNLSAPLNSSNSVANPSKKYLLHRLAYSSPGRDKQTHTGRYSSVAMSCPTHNTSGAPGLDAAHPIRLHYFFGRGRAEQCDTTTAEVAMRCRQAATGAINGVTI
eukprot:1188374-Prorocentrum_minimum.AAC.4